MYNRLMEDVLQGGVYYEEVGQFIHRRIDNNVIADVRGWGLMQKIAKDVYKAEELHDSLGEFIARAINEAIEKWNKENENA